MTTIDDSSEMVPGANKSGGVEFGFDSSAGFFALIMTESGEPGLVKGKKDTGFYLEIEPADTWKIVLTLDQQCHWQFDDPAITFKNPADAKFYEIVSSGPQRVVIKAQSTLSSVPPKPWPEVIHRFNLNLVVKQSAGHSYKLSIDPDIKNPPTRPN